MMVEHNMPKALHLRPTLPMPFWTWSIARTCLISASQEVHHKEERILTSMRSSVQILRALPLWLI